MTQGPDGPAPALVRARRPGGVLGLFDAPLHWDWLFWWTVVWASMVAVGELTSPDLHTGGPAAVWANGVATVAFTAVLLGILPAAVRLAWRRRRLRRPTPPTPAPWTAPALWTAPAVAGPAPPAVPPAHPADPAGGSAVQAAPTFSARPGPAANGRPAGAAARPLTVPAGRLAAGVPGPLGTGAAGPGRGATFPDALDPDALDPDALDEARTTLPSPIARAVRRLQIAPDPQTRYEATLRCAEIVATVVGVVVLTWFRGRSAPPPALRKWHDSIRRSGLSQGHWVEATRSVARFAASPDAPPGMAAALRTEHGRGLYPSLRTIGEERNRWAHSAGPRGPLDAADRVERLLPDLTEALRRAAFLAAYPWVLVERAAYRPRQRTFDVRGRRIMGDHPDFDLMTFETAVPLGEDVVYALTPTPLDLTPLVVARDCPICQQKEIYFSDRVDGRGRVMLKNPTTGHSLLDEDLARDVHALF